MKFETRYENLQKEGVKFKQPSLTRQSEKDSCDVNKIMERFNRTGVFPQQITSPFYGDATGVNYQEAMEIIADAKETFESLPNAAKKAFNYNPQLFMEALNDSSPENTKKLLKLGILVERKRDAGQILESIESGIKTIAEIRSELEESDKKEKLKK